MKQPTYEEVQRWLRLKSTRTWGGAIRPEYLRGYLHALDDVYRWTQSGMRPRVPHDRDVS